MQLPNSFPLGPWTRAESGLLGRGFLAALLHEAWMVRLLRMVPAQALGIPPLATLNPSPSAGS